MIRESQQGLLSNPKNLYTDTGRGAGFRDFGNINQWVLSIVKDGYRIEFVHHPPFMPVRETPLTKGDFHEVLLEEVQTKTIELIP